MKENSTQKYIDVNLFKLSDSNSQGSDRVYKSSKIGNIGYKLLLFFFLVLHGLTNIQLHGQTPNTNLDMTGESVVFISGTSADYPPSVNPPVTSTSRTYELTLTDFIACYGTWTCYSGNGCRGTIVSSNASSCSATFSNFTNTPQIVTLSYVGYGEDRAGFTDCYGTTQLTSSIDITVYPCGSSISGPSSNGCYGTGVALSADYTAVTSGGDYNVYQWLDNNGAIVGTASTLSVKASGTYSLITANGTCSIKSVNKTVTINPPLISPMLTTLSTGLCPGGSVLLTASSKVAGLTYQWYSTASSSPLQNATGTTYSATAAGTYYVQGTNKSTGCLSPGSNTISLLVNTIPTASITAGGPTTFCTGGNVVLSAATGNGLTYVWKNGTATVGTASSYTATKTGNYTVTVGSATNCSAALTSPATTVTVNTIPTASFSSSGNATSFCAGNGLVLNANTGKNLTYQWINNGTVLNTTPSASASYTASIGGSYSVNIIQNYPNGYTCSKTSSALNITANDVPSTALATINPADSATLCLNGNVLLSAGKGINLSYQWNNNGAAISGATNSSYTATVAGNFTVTVGSIAGTSCGPAVVSSSPTIVNLVSPPQAIIKTNGSASICPGGSLGLNANTGTGSIYQWFDQAGIISGATNPTYTATKAGQYTVKIIYNNGCPSTSAPLTLAVNTVPTVTVTPSTNPIVLCGQNSVTLTANATGMGLYYQWQNVSGGLISGATASTFTTHTSGSYQVKVFNDCGNIVSTPVNVLAPVQGQLNISIGSVAGFNAGDFTSVAYGSCGITFETPIGARDFPNTFTVQLSDIYGRFTNPEVIGSLYSGNPSTTINIHIPNDHPIGDHYRIRVVSDSPAIIGNDNGVDFSIYPQNSGSLFFPAGTQVVMPGNAAYNFPGDFTIELNVKLISSSPGHIIPLLGDALNWRNFFIYSYEFSDGSQAGSTELIFGNTSVYCDALKHNVCSHLAFVRISGVLTVFLDGKAIQSVPSTQLLSLPTSFVIGKNDNLYGGRYYIDELRLWNVGLLASDLINNTHTIVTKDRLGLVGYWDFNESSGQVVYDQSNTANHGILGSTSSIESTDPTRAGDLGCAPIPPIPSNGLLFNGTYDGTRATIPPSPAYNIGTRDFTLEARVILSASQPYPATAMASNRAEISYQYSGFLFTAYQGTSLLLQLQGVNYMASIGKNINDGTCHHVAVTRLNGALQFYVDGVAIGGLVNCGASISSSATLYLGFDVLDDFSLNGAVNEFRIWNTNRTATQISANMNTVFSANTPNLTGYWRLNEPSGETIFDSSPTGNNGYLGTDAFVIDSRNPGRNNHSCYSGDRLAAAADLSEKITIDSSSFSNINTVKIYPNPFTTETNIFVSGNDIDQAKIKITNLQGLTLYTEQITSNKTYSIGQQLSNGVYYIEVKGDNKRPQIFKIIKNE